MSGTLYLLPCPIAAVPVEAALPAEVIRLARGLTHFLVEDAKSARSFLKALGHPRPVRELFIFEIGHQPRRSDIDGWLDPVRSGVDAAIVSEAGCPAIADPGATIVAAAHARGIRVRPLTGPSSIVLALMAAGLDGQRFRFHGYLPIEASARTAAMKSLERDSKARIETQVFIETPYRSAALYEALLAACADSTRIAVAADLTGSHGFVGMRSVQQWKACTAVERPSLQRLPAVFCLLAG
jgi:16S rRNA (cytidine1402-2'-O)-methyltransferase